MGWCSGTDVFVPVAQAIIDSDASEETKVKLLVTLIQTLWNEDWDCEWDTSLVEQPLVKRAFLQLDPSFYDGADADWTDGEHDKTGDDW